MQKGRVYRMKSNNELVLTSTGIPISRKLEAIAQAARYYANAASELEGARATKQEADERLTKAERAYASAYVNLNNAIEQQ